jgi:hypothetical protein
MRRGNVQKNAANESMILGRVLLIFRFKSSQSRDPKNLPVILGAIR